MDTVYPLELRYICKAFTSVPVEPRVSDLVKVVGVMVVVDGVMVVVGQVVRGTLVFNVLLYLVTDAAVSGP